MGRVFAVTLQRDSETWGYGCYGAIGLIGLISPISLMGLMGPIGLIGLIGLMSFIGEYESNNYTILRRCQHGIGTSHSGGDGL